MSLTNPEVLHLLLALSALLASAHLSGYLFVRMRQPRVVGEIVGGLLLGPTVLGWFLPTWSHQLVDGSRVTTAVLGAVYQLGQLLLMFCAGSALQATRRRGERRTTSLIALAGNIVPFAAGLLFVAVHDPGSLLGPAGNRVAFLLVFACGVAVTSIPVISKIMADLGLLGTSFARIVLSVAVLEDFVLYVLLSIAVGLVTPSQTGGLSLPALLSIRADSPAAEAYYVLASLAFFSLPLMLGRSSLSRLTSLRGNFLGRSNALAFQVMFMMMMTSLALFLGVSGIFGAFIAGILSGTLTGEDAQAREAIQRFSFGFFIPVYFAIVGLQLDLLHQLDLVFFTVFLVVAGSVKALSVYAGARLAGEPRREALNLAVALNARGGPAIVLASTALGAGIISRHFYVDLVLLAIVTSMAAGSWLERAIRRGDFVGVEPLRATGSRAPAVVADGLEITAAS